MVPFESLGAVSYSHSIVTMALSYISSEIKLDICRKSHPLAFWHPFRRNVAIPFATEKKLEWWGHPTVKNVEDCVIV